MNETNVVVYSGFTAWSDDDTYADGYAASLLGIPGTVLVVAVQVDVRDTGISAISYGGQSLFPGNTDPTNGISFFVLDLIANPPSDDSLSITVYDDQPFLWTAMTVQGVDATQTALAYANSASALVVAAPPWAPFCVFPGGIFAWFVQTYGDGSSCEYMSTDPAPFSTPVTSADPVFLTGTLSAFYQQAVGINPTYTLQASDGSTTAPSCLFLFPLIALLTQYAGARLQQVYPPVMLAKAATINPKIYMPVQDLTVKTKP